MVKVRLFCWWCCVCCIVLLALCFIILRARHDHNKIAPCGMIKVFLIELNKKLPAVQQGRVLHTSTHSLESPPKRNMSIVLKQGKQVAGDNCIPPSGVH